MQRDAAESLLRRSGLAGRVSEILPHLLPGVRIHATRAPALEGSLVSRFAGRGVLPRGEPWPVWDSSALHQRWIEYCRTSMARRRTSTAFWNQEVARYQALIRDNPRPLHFLAMVRLTDLALAAARLGLPDHGALLVFLDVEHCHPTSWAEARGGWRVFYVADDDELEVVDPPAQARTDHVPCALRYELHDTLPNTLARETGDHDLHAFGDTAYARVHAALLGGDADPPIVHQLGGAPQEVQRGLFHACQQAADRVDDGDSRQGAKDWRLLLQLDSDEAGPNWMWGDVGRIYLCIHRDDLAAHRFDRVQCIAQSH